MSNVNKVKDIIENDEESRDLLERTLFEDVNSVAVSRYVNDLTNKLNEKFEVDDFDVKLEGSSRFVVSSKSALDGTRVLVEVRRVEVDIEEILGENDNEVVK